MILFDDLQLIECRVSAICRNNKSSLPEPYDTEFFTTLHFVVQSKNIYIIIISFIKDEGPVM